MRTGKKTLTLCSAHLPADQDKELYEAACDRLQDHLRRKQRVILGIDANAQLTQQHVTVPYIGEFVLPASSLTGERDLAKAAAFAGAMMTAGLTVASTMTPLLDAAQRAHGPQTRKHRTLDYLCIKDLSLSGATIGSPPATMWRSDHRALAINLPSRSSQVYRFEKVRPMRTWQPVSDEARLQINNEFRDRVLADEEHDVRHIQAALESIMEEQRKAFAVPSLSHRALKRLKKAAAREKAKWDETMPDDSPQHAASHSQGAQAAASSTVVASSHSQGAMGMDFHELDGEPDPSHSQGATAPPDPTSDDEIPLAMSAAERDVQEQARAGVRCERRLPIPDHLKAASDDVLLGVASDPQKEHFQAAINELTLRVRRDLLRRSRLHTRFHCRKEARPAALGDARGHYAEDTELWPSIMQEYYEKKYCTCTYAEPLITENLEHLWQEAQHEDYVSISPTLLRACLQKMRCGKATGLDGIPVRLLKTLDDGNLELLREAFERRINCTGRPGEQPWAWSHHLVTLIPKTGDIRSLDRWRPITLVGALLKLYESVLIALLEANCMSPLSNRMVGFRPSRQTMDITEGIRWMLQRADEWGMPLFVVSVDVKQAFDRMHWQTVSAAFSEEGVSAKLRHAVTKEYTDQHLIPHLGSVQVAAPIRLGRGGRQGGTGTPYCWNRLLHPSVERLACLWAQSGTYPKWLAVDDYETTTGYYLPWWVIQVWADNIYFFCDCLEDVVYNLDSLWQELRAYRLHLKSDEYAILTNQAAFRGLWATHHSIGYCSPALCGTTSIPRHYYSYCWGAALGPSHSLGARPQDDGAAVRTAASHSQGARSLSWPAYIMETKDPSGWVHFLRRCHARRVDTDLTLHWPDVSNVLPWHERLPSLTVRWHSDEGEVRTTLRLSDSATILGIWLNSVGSTASSLQHRITQAQILWAKNRGFYMNRRVSLTTRLTVWYEEVGASALYGCGGWSAKSDTLRALHAWATKFQRVMTRANKGDKEEWSAFNTRRDLILQEVRNNSNGKLMPLIYAALVQIARWYGHCWRASPDATLAATMLRWRNLLWWKTVSFLGLSWDEKNTTGWKHTKTRLRFHYEQPFDEIFGLAEVRDLLRDRGRWAGYHVWLFARVWLDQHMPKVLLTVRHDWLLSRRHPGAWFLRRRLDEVDHFNRELPGPWTPMACTTSSPTPCIISGLLGALFSYSLDSDPLGPPTMPRPCAHPWLPRIQRSASDFCDLFGFSSLTTGPSSTPGLVRMELAPRTRDRASIEARDLLSISYYTDGSYGAKDTMMAGWGYVMVEQQWVRQTDTSDFHGDGIVAHESYGPVLTHTRDPLWLGACSHSNNTGELSAIIEVLLWLRDYDDYPGDHRDAYIYYDSCYAAEVLCGIKHASRNVELVLYGNALLAELRSYRMVALEHVRAHQGHRWNEHADRLADRGSRGEVAPVGRYSGSPVVRRGGALPAAPRASAKGRVRPGLLLVGTEQFIVNCLNGPWLDKNSLVAILFRDLSVYVNRVGSVRCYGAPATYSVAQAPPYRQFRSQSDLLRMIMLAVYHGQPISFTIALHAWGGSMTAQWTHRSMEVLAVHSAWKDALRCCLMLLRLIVYVGWWDRPPRPG